MAARANPTILIAAAPGPLRAALEALVRSLPGPPEVEGGADGAWILERLRSRPVALVIVAAGPGERWVISPRTIRQAAPGCRVVLLAADAARLPPGAESADRVLQQGLAAGVLVSELERLMEGDGNG